MFIIFSMVISCNLPWTGFMEFLDPYSPGGPLLKQKKIMFIYHLFCVAFVLKTLGGHQRWRCPDKGMR